jgi:DNA mismatch repair protein MutS
VPNDVVARARSVLDRLEKGRAETGGLAAGLGDLPLFAAAASLQEEECDELRERLQTLDVDALTPKQALELLYELKREASE